MSVLDVCDPMTVVTWDVRSDGLHVWRDGDLVALIEHGMFPHVIEDLARGLLEKTQENIKHMYC